MDEASDLKKEVSKLKSEIDLIKGANYILGEIIKYSGSIFEFSELVSVITDVLIGVMGLNACSIWVSRDNQDVYDLYSRNHMGFLQEMSSDLPTYLMKAKDAFVFEVNNSNMKFFRAEKTNSMLVVPLEDFKQMKRVGVIVAEHNTNEYFDESKINFFKLVAIQMSIAMLNCSIMERMKENTIKDTLTECYNRNYLNNIIQNSSPKKNFTMGVFDLDNFKAINDNLGHGVGDWVLIKISKIAREEMEKEEGKIIRYGGDEFILIMEKDLNTSMRVFEKIQERIREDQEIKALSQKVSVTIGVSSYPEHTTDMSELFAQADDALIRAKSRNHKDSINIWGID